MCFFYVSLFWKALEKKSGKNLWTVIVYMGTAPATSTTWFHWSSREGYYHIIQPSNQNFRVLIKWRHCGNISQIYHICIYTQILWNAIAWGKGSFLKAFIYTACIACTALLREDSWVSSSKFPYVPGEKLRRSEPAATSHSPSTLQLRQKKPLKHVFPIDFEDLPTMDLGPTPEFVGLCCSSPGRWNKQDLHPQKTNMTMENHPFLNRRPIFKWFLFYCQAKCLRGVHPSRYNKYLNHL